MKIFVIEVGAICWLQPFDVFFSFFLLPKLHLEARKIRLDCRLAFHCNESFVIFFLATSLFKVPQSKCCGDKRASLGTHLYTKIVLGEILNF